MRRAALLLLALSLGTLMVPSMLRWEEVPFHRDLLDFFLPMKAAFVRAVAGGHVPWWDPFTHGGQPFFATLQSQVLYPPNLLFLLGAPLGWSLSAFLVFHLAWAGIGAFSLARELGASRGTALLALLGVECGGFLVSLCDLLNQACAQAWIPWILLAACRSARLSTRRELAAWAACCALAFLAGEPQYAAAGGLASVALAWARARALGAPAHRALWGGVMAGGLALLACVVQVVPLAELALGSTRATSDFTEGGRHALEPARLVAVIRAPEGPFGGPAGTLVESIHLGAVLLLLAAAAAVASILRKDGTTRMLGVLTVLSVALALGPHLPVLGRALLEATPFLRYPVKHFAVAAVTLPVLAALGAEQLRRHLDRRSPRAAGPLLAAVTCLAGLELVMAQRVLVPSLPSEPLLRATPLISFLQGATRPDGPRVHSTPVTGQRLSRRTARMSSGDVAGAMRERVELLEGALPMYFGICSTWGGTALPPAEQEELLDATTGPLTRAEVQRLRVAWIIDAAPRVLPLTPLEIEGGAARPYVLEGFSPPSPRSWDGPNRCVGLPGQAAPSAWPGWREAPPGTWTFRPTGLLPCGAVSAVTWLLLAVMAFAPRRSGVANDGPTR